MLWISGFLGVISIAVWIVWGFTLSIDFTGGTLIELSIPQSQVTAQELTTEIKKVETSLAKEFAHDQTSSGSIIADFGDPVITPHSDSNTFSVKIKPINEQTNTKLIEGLRTTYPTLESQKFSTIGPIMGTTLMKNSLIALLLGCLAIIIYIAFAFRRVPKMVSSWKFGATAILALIHDLLLVCGVFIILGKLFHVEVGTLFITALLTVLGYSVQDTIVVFDRIRENLIIKKPHETLRDIAEKSMQQTWARSLNNSITLWLTLLSLLIVGSESVRWFIVALLLGTLFGTYSSIFIASPALIYWSESKNEKKAHKK